VVEMQSKKKPKKIKPFIRLDAKPTKPFAVERPRNNRKKTKVQLSELKGYLNRKEFV
jgi:hypothetical protein